VSLGLSSKGDRWNRPNATVGIAGAVNGMSPGRLASYGEEGIVEAYYSLAPFEALALSFDYQYVVNPAYDRDRGPVSVFGLRVHAEL
jgi:high affinity Mn2+ porin